VYHQDDGLFGTSFLVVPISLESFQGTAVGLGGQRRT
jgi:hypothetical protein